LKFTIDITFITLKVCIAVLYNPVLALKCLLPVK